MSNTNASSIANSDVLYYRNVRSEIAEYVNRGDNYVLDVGCGAGYFGEYLKKSGRAEKVVGIEIDEVAATEALTKLDQVYVTNLNQTSVIETLNDFDNAVFNYIVCADVLEHLIDPWKVLAELVLYLKPNGRLVVSIPNVQHWSVWIPLILRGKWEYRDDGIMDRTHLRFFTRGSVAKLLSGAKLNIAVDDTLIRGKWRTLDKITLGLLSNFISTQFVFVGTKKLKNEAQWERPNFFVVGAAKAGTSSLGDYLSRHPDVYVSPVKEPHFFSTDIRMAHFRADYRNRVYFDVQAYLSNHPLEYKHIAHIEDRSQYLGLFREVKNEKAIGELSTGYLYSSYAADNLFEFNPDARIVMVLRQPVHRAYSHYVMNLRDLWDCNSGFINALERDFTASEKGWGRSHLYVELGLYFEQVSRYLKRFPEKQVKIFLYEDFQNDPAGFIRELCTFLGVSPSALGGVDMRERKHVAALPRFKISGIYFSSLKVLSGYIGMVMPDKLKPLVRNVIFSKRNVPKLREDEFNQAMKYFRDDIQKLSVLIKRDLQSWHKMSK